MYGSLTVLPTSFFEYFCTAISFSKKCMHKSNHLSLYSLDKFSQVLESNLINFIFLQLLPKMVCYNGAVLNIDFSNQNKTDSAFAA